MAVVRRVYLYGIAFVALWMLINGAGGLLAIALATVVQRASGAVTTVGADELRGQVSSSLALLVIGLVAWAIHWLLAQRLVGADGGEPSAGQVERRSAIRKLFLYAVLFSGGVALTIAGRELLRDLLSLLFGRLPVGDVVSGSLVAPLARLIVTGVVWAYYAQVASADRALAPETGAGATLRRWCVYALSFIGLLAALFAAVGLIETLWQSVVPAAGAVTTSRGDYLASTVAGDLSTLLAGLALWLPAWVWSTGWLARPEGDADPESRSVLRKVYLYLVLAVSVAWTVWNVGQILYRLLEALLLAGRPANEPGGLLYQLGGSLGAALVFGVAWLYHARAVRREAALATELRRQAVIRWLYGYLVALIGVVTLAVGLGGTLATALDLLVQPGAVRPTNWWQDRISLFSTLILVGLPVWLVPWTRLQREAADPAARGALIRRIYLFVAFGLSVLTLLGSGAFTLYQLIRLALGDRWTAGQTSELAQAASAALVAALFLVYHLRVFRADLAPAAAVTGTSPLAEPGVVEAAVVVLRARDQGLLAAFEREVKARAPAGVEVALVRVDPQSADRLLDEARRAAASAGG